MEAAKMIFQDYQGKLASVLTHSLGLDAVQGQTFYLMGPWLLPTMAAFTCH